MKPVFILSAPRTGSTLLRYLVDTHSKIASPGELALGRLARHLQRTVDRTLGATTSGTPEERQERVREEILRIVSSLLTPYVESKGKEVWCEKTPDNLEHTDLLIELFPDARFLCLHRNCLDVVHSCLDVSRYGFMPELADYAARHPRSLVTAMVEAWAEKTDKLLAFEAEHTDQCHRIQYEELVLHPEDTLPPVFEFLGLSWEPEILERVFQVPHDQGGGDPKARLSKKIRKRIGQGSSIRREQIRSDWLTRMNGLLAQLGYPLVDEEWNDRPSPYLPPDETTDTAQGEKPSGGNTAGDREERLQQIETLFRHHVQRKLAAHPEVAQRLDSVFKFELSDLEAVTWTIDLSGEEPRVSPASDEPGATCTLMAESSILISLFKGELHPMEAFQQKKFHIEGNPAEMQHLAILF